MTAKQLSLAATVYNFKYW